MDVYKWLEFIAVGFNLAFLLLLMKEIIWSWLCGIIGSLLSVVLFFQTKLYSEAILYGFYVIIGFYGWYVWYHKGLQQKFNIRKWPLHYHIISIAVGFLLAWGVGSLFQSYTDADKPFIDAHTTVFSFIASYLEAHKILSSWIYWIVINGVTIWLYGTKDLTIYSALMVIYLVLSFVGLWQWNQRYQAQPRVQ